jgi:hypothetical protein
MESQSATPPTYSSVQNANQPEIPQHPLNSDWFRLKFVPLGRLELPFLAPEANALSTELQGR